MGSGLSHPVVPLLSEKKNGPRAIFPAVPWQRCQFHLIQNPQPSARRLEERRKIAQAMRDIFNSPTLEDDPGQGGFLSGRLSGPQSVLGASSGRWMLAGGPRGLRPDYLLRQRSEGGPTRSSLLEKPVATNPSHYLDLIYERVGVFRSARVLYPALF